MSMSANFHRVESMEAWDLGESSSLIIKNSSGDHVAIFMPYAVAKATADTFNKGMADHAIAASEGVEA